MLSIKQDSEKLDDKFEELFNSYWKKLYVIAYNRVKDKELAKDLVQDVFIYYLQKRDELILKTSIEAYLRKALQYQIIAYYRKHLINTRAFDQIIYQLSLQETILNHSLETNDLLNSVKREINKMPASMHTVFDLRIKDYGIDEISEKTGLSEKTVRNNISMGLNRLKKAIAEDFPNDYVTVFLIVSVLINV
ncbi:MAG: sigma-70 family RNA polymerase sigma factor [Pedobacter sp.]|uniref:RNA polymerase sigma factor n=1 Tax=Pedobacter sp. TaxID=1411316 RepID=UPI003561774F